jgi:hypothetical protein
MTQLTGSPHEPGRTCTKCQTVKPLPAFHLFGKDRSRTGKWCEDCYQKYVGGKLKPKRLRQ